MFNNKVNNMGPYCTVWNRINFGRHYATFSYQISKIRKNKKVKKRRNS